MVFDVTDQIQHQFQGIQIYTKCVWIKQRANQISLFLFLCEDH